MHDLTEFPDTPTTPSAPEHTAPVRQRWLRWLVVSMALVLLLGALMLWWLSLAPDYQGERSVVVTPGMGVSEVVADAAAAGVVRSELLLYLVTQLWYPNETIETGTYSFTAAQNTRSVASELMLVTPPDELVRLTFPEGIPRTEMAAIAADTLVDFATSTFLDQTATAEGLLWPETYFIPPTFSASELATLLRDSFRTAMDERAEAITAHPLGEYEIVTLASIVEREANDRESMALVAGILLNRLDAGMYLQADASIEYVLDTPLNELAPGQLAENLREIDSPYNTYRTLGLPPTPIGNPGAQAIDAVLNPAVSDYFFYLTAPDGTFYYAETYEQHLVNIERYLR